MAVINISTGLWLEYTYVCESQSISANTSSVRVDVYLKSNTGSIVNAPGTRNGYIEIDGERQDFSSPVVIGTNAQLLLATKVFNVKHEEDGSKLANIKVSFDLNTYISDVYKGTLSGSSNFNLPTIPRSSTVTINALQLPSRNIVGNIVAPAGGIAKHECSIYCDTDLLGQFEKWGGGSFTFTVSTAQITSLLTAMNYGEERQLSITVRTYINDVNIGSNSNTNTLSTIRKPQITPLKPKYDMLTDNNISVELSQTTAGVSYNASITSPNLSKYSSSFAITSDVIEKLCKPHSKLSEINESLTCTVDILYNGITVKTENYPAGVIIANSNPLFTGNKDPYTSFNIADHTKEKYPIQLTLTEGNYSSAILNQVSVLLNVNGVASPIQTLYVARAKETTLYTTKATMDIIAQQDTGVNDFEYTVPAVLTLKLYNINVYQVETALTVRKRSIIEITNETENTYAGIGTYLFNSNWSAYADKLNKLFISNSPVPQFFYIPIDVQLPEWELRNEENQPITLRLPTKDLFDKIMLNGITDLKTRTMMYLLCMHEESIDSNYYKPNEHITEKINAVITKTTKLVLDETGYPTIDYVQDEMDIVINALKYHATSGVPYFETNRGNLCAYVGSYKFENLNEIRIIPLNVEGYYSDKVESHLEEESLSVYDVVNVSAYYKADGSKVTQATNIVITDTKTNNTINKKYSGCLVGTDKTVYYFNDSDITSNVATKVSADNVFTSGNKGMNFSTSVSETFNIMGYAGGYVQYNVGDMIYIDPSATNGYPNQGSYSQIKDIKRRFYNCLSVLKLPKVASYSDIVYIVDVGNAYIGLLAQDVINTKSYYDKLFGGKYPESSPIYIGVKMTSSKPKHYTPWTTDNIKVTIIESDIQSTLFQVTVDNYSNNEVFPFKIYVPENDKVEKTVTLSSYSILVYLKSDIPKEDYTVEIVQQDLFNKSVVTFSKKALKPYMFIDTNLESVGLLKYPENKNSVEFPK